MSNVTFIKRMIDKSATGRTIFLGAMKGAQRRKVKPQFVPRRKPIGQYRRHEGRKIKIYWAKDIDGKDLWDKEPLFALFMPKDAVKNPDGSYKKAHNENDSNFNDWRNGLGNTGTP